MSRKKGLMMGLRPGVTIWYSSGGAANRAVINHVVDGADGALAIHVDFYTELGYTHRGKIIVQGEPNGEFDIEQMHELLCATEISQVVNRMVTGGVRLWRIWRHRQGFLYPLTRDEKWQKSSEVVRCDTLPQMGGHGGFYGFYELKELRRQESNMVDMSRRGDSDGFTYVLGSFMGFGRLIRADAGCRVEYAKPEYLILPDQNEDYCLELMTLAVEYGMKPITAEQARSLKTGLIGSWAKPGNGSDPYNA